MAGMHSKTIQRRINIRSKCIQEDTQVGLRFSPFKNMYKITAEFEMKWQGDGRIEMSQ